MQVLDICATNWADQRIEAICLLEYLKLQAGWLNSLAEDDRNVRGNIVIQNKKRRAENVNRRYRS